MARAWWTMGDLTYDSFIGLLRSSVRGVDDLYRKHVECYDELLQHVFFGDLTRFVLSEAQTHGKESSVLRQIMPLLEAGMGSDDEKLQELIAVSFLENLLPEDGGFEVVRAWFGPKLEEQYLKFGYL